MQNYGCVSLHNIIITKPLKIKTKYFILPKAHGGGQPSSYFYLLCFKKYNKKQLKQLKINRKCNNAQIDYRICDKNM